MTTETLHARESLIGRVIAATGRRLLPGELSGGMTLTLPSGRRHRIGFQKPGIQCDLTLRNYRPVFPAMRLLQEPGRPPLPPAAPEHPCRGPPQHQRPL